ncbi:MAG: hypothetical protein JRG96_17140 [Deltaproteobacteria bacterium]|nr:hypothetical protein [Deltaproteobacteria bacterium]MBW2416984.1 hypothetical protein [Deltaproteobacteria bacterium]
MGGFEAFYASPIQHPVLLWLAAALALGWSATRSGLHPTLRRYCVLLVALSLVDAWLTSNPIYGIGQLGGWAASAVPLFFVLAGDFRYLLLLGAATPDGGFEPSARHLLVAAGLTLIVPVFSQVVVMALPDSPSGARVLFLVYEVAFMLLTLALMRWHPGARAAPWLTRVSRFVLLYYGLWASADAIIIATGSDLGFLLRVLPNLLYYGGLIGVVAGSAARVPRGSGVAGDLP